jgi:light-regulated signal transduction histidine kinase (bacteriophytochrome)
MNPTAAPDSASLSRYDDLLYRITLRIRQSLELQEILEATVAEVRSFLGTDRVKIYRFHPDGSGEVIAEALQVDRLPSLRGLNFPADDIPPYARELFVKARQRVAVDVVAQLTTGFTPPNDWESYTGSPEPDIRRRPVDPCHIEYLNAMQVKSSVVVPILHQERLWGLLVSHHSEPRTVAEAELQFIGAVADQVEIAIAQSALLEHMRQQAEREAQINHIASLLHTAPTVQLQSGLEAAVQAFQGCGGRIYLRASSPDQADEFYTCGTQPTALINSNGRQIEQHLMWQQYLNAPGTAICQIEAQQDSGSEPWSAQWLKSAYTSQIERPNPQSWPIDNIYQEPLLRTLVGSFQSTAIRGVIIVPLRYGEQTLGCYTIFRPQIAIERLWAGQCENDKRQLIPQMSFEAWRELKSGQSQPWTQNEVKLAQALGRHFAMAVHQHCTYRQVQSLNASLERQVKVRTAELQKLVEQQQQFSCVVARMRETLDLKVVFRALTQEICQLLQDDRVGVYRFNADWSGEFIQEWVTPGWVRLVDHPCLSNWQDTHLQATQGGRYRHNDTSAVNDIYTIEHSPCYLEQLEQIQARAYVTVPIFVGQTLWGLLSTYQNAGPRDWQPSEVNLLGQTGAQLGVAIQHSELLQQTQQQAEQLTLALDDLKRTQSQLIQTEKMSSLGQLVAGVAHEINNPINFIAGNLEHVQEYAQTLLNVLQVPAVNTIDATAANHLDVNDVTFIAEDLPKVLSSMRVGVDRIRQIVLSLRNFSRIDQAAVKAVDIHEGIDSTLLILQHRLKAVGDRSGIEIVKHYGQLPSVECYAGQLNQVFMNLLSNAIDALEDRDRQQHRVEDASNPKMITICTGLVTSVEGQPYVSIRIADNGSGMTNHAQMHLFEPFFTTKPIGRGTGLGLAISYQIVTERHGGHLRCISQLGKGTEFQLEIPLH